MKITTQINDHNGTAVFRFVRAEDEPEQMISLIRFDPDTNDLSMRGRFTQEEAYKVGRAMNEFALSRSGDISRPRRLRYLEGTEPRVVRALCLDFDGTIRRSKSGHEFIQSPDDVELFPDVEDRLSQFYDANVDPQWVIFGITNQGGVAFGFRSWDDVLSEIVNTVLLLDRPEMFSYIAWCPYHADGTDRKYRMRSLNRKPEIGMLAEIETNAQESGLLIDWDRSLFVGDRSEDRECAERAGMMFTPAHEFFGREEGAEK